MAGIRILDLVPVMVTEALRGAMEDRRRLAEELRASTGGLVELEVEALDMGTASIESLYDEYVNAPYILAKVREAEERGFNAVVIDCFGDPALEAARELVDIPVVGAHHSACHLAAQLAGRYTIINILPETRHQILSLQAKYGLTGHLASIETIDVPVLEIEEKSGEALERIVEAALRAYREHNAFAAVLGCTGLSFLAQRAQEGLAARGAEIPVIEPLRAAVYTAISWALMGVSHSRAAYMKPRPKPRRADFKLPL
ncbi:MAG: aspartate/glutamate racemase family protein [Desulfurococcales archaeon]|nr:aspartate/glutamate racemase family protein [Desulfurococcales archaeon]